MKITTVSDSETAHTAGPWTAEPTMPSDGFNCWHIATPSGDIAWSKGYQHEPEKQANALLIAAAPDLLAALKAVVRISDRKHDAWDFAHAVIARAEGKEQGS